MRKNISLILISIVIAGAFVIVQADNDYLIGTRGEGIGFAFSALANEPFGALYNPAGPAFARGLQTQLGYQHPTKYGLSMVDESPYGGSLGLNYHNPAYGNIILNSHQFGSFADPSYVTTINSVDLSYARSFNEQLATGISFKYMFESNFEKRKVFDLDVGFSYHPLRQISLAAVGKNLLKAKFTPDDVYSSHLSRKFSLAGAYHIPLADNTASILAGWQLEQAGEAETNNTSLFNVATELWLAAYSPISLGIRGGYIFGKATVGDVEMDYNRWCAGLSLNFDIHGQDLRLDYAVRAYPFENNETLTADNFLAISYGWGGVPDYFGGKPAKTYDLTKYNKAQTWHTPAAVATHPAVEQKPPTKSQSIELGPPAETSAEPEPVSEAPVEQEPAPQLPVKQMPVAVAPPVADNPPAKTPSPAPEPKTETPTVAQNPPAETTPVAEIQPAEPEMTIAQNTIEPEPTIPGQPKQPEKAYETQQPQVAEQPQPIEFLDLKLHLEATQMDAMRGTRIIFSLRPDGLLNLVSWKLYVFGVKLKDWNESLVDDYALAVIKGKGVTPLSVIWDGTLEKGGTVRPGKYYFVVIGANSYGDHYMSDWCKFKIK